MSIGLTKAKEALEKITPSTINEVFSTTGMTMIKSMGGASGVIFGTMFFGGVKGMEPKTELDLSLLAEIFDRALMSIKERGKAQVGDKTMIDAFEPAVISLKESAKLSKNLAEGVSAAEEAARQGMENTKNYVAKFGRAKSLGERAIGCQDAGATSVWIIIRSMKEWIEQNRKV
jgi:dihydroxyacetone kinase-like protein